MFTGAALVAALPLPAWAHKQKTTLTEIVWNSRDKLLEITHTYHMHDAETALAYIGVLAKPDLTSLKERARLCLYTDANFALQDMDGQTLDLELIGADIDGVRAYVFQQVSLESPPENLLIFCSLLRDIIEGQINNVDFKPAGTVHSVLFEANDGPKKALA